MVDDMNPTATPVPDPTASLEARFQAEKAIVDKHGYYYSVLSDEEKIAYRLAASREGFDQEIQLIMTKIHSMQVLFPFNFAMLGRFVNLLERLKKTHARLFNKEREADSEKKMDNISDRLSSSFGVPMNRAQRRAMARA
jgi:hypothetical protein